MRLNGKKFLFDRTRKFIRGSYMKGKPAFDSVKRFLGGDTYKDVLLPHSKNVTVALKTAAKEGFSNPMRNFMMSNIGWGSRGLAIGFGAAVGAFAISRSIFETMTWLSPEQRAHEQAVGAGSGIISWSKKQGMPSNHLSTNGLSLAAHDMRHSSSI